MEQDQTIVMSTWTRIVSPVITDAEHNTAHAECRMG